MTTEKPVDLFQNEVYEGIPEALVEKMKTPAAVTLTMDNWAAVSGVLAGAADEWQENLPDHAEHLRRLGQEIDRQVEDFITSGRAD